MNRYLTAALVSGVPIVLCATSAMAQETAQNPQSSPRLSWEASIEIGLEEVFRSNTAGNEIRDIYATGEAAVEFALSDRLSLFAGLTWESMTGATADRSFDDMGLYFHELGVQFEVGPASFQIGKVSPTFGNAWDSAAGFFATSLAEDYELAEQIGVLGEVELGDGSALSLGVFYADNTALSESTGFNRGRNTTAGGGAGNTGKFDNIAVQWSKQLGDTYFHIGARHLSAGLGDVSDETGFVAGIGHTFATAPIDVFVEFASFDGFGGSTDSATYATLNAAYTLGDVVISGTYAQRDVTSAGKTTLISLAAEYEINDRVLIGGGIAHVEDAGVEDDIIGLNIVFTLGG